MDEDSGVRNITLELKHTKRIIDVTTQRNTYPGIQMKTQSQTDNRYKGLGVHSVFEAGEVGQVTGYCTIPSHC